VKLLLSPGQAHEMTKAFELLADVGDAYVAGDSAYCSSPLIAQLVAQRCTPVIAMNPTHKARRDDPFDTHLYRERCLVEHFFQRIKRFRRIAMRFEKLARNFMAFLHLASMLVWLL
jgi:transposase